MSFERKMKISLTSRVSVLLRALVLFVACSAPVKASEELFRVISKFKDCQIEGAFYPGNGSAYKGKVKGLFLEEYLNNLFPVEQRSGIARFRVFDSLLGLHIIWLDIPVYASRDDNQLWRVFFIEDYETVRKVISASFGMVFPPSPQSTKSYIRGKSPALLIDKSGVVYLICRKTEMGY